MRENEHVACHIRGPGSCLLYYSNYRRLSRVISPSVALLIGEVGKINLCGSLYGCHSERVWRLAFSPTCGGVEGGGGGEGFGWLVFYARSVGTVPSWRGWLVVGRLTSEESTSVSQRLISSDKRTCCLH